MRQTSKKGNDKMKRWNLFSGILIQTTKGRAMHHRGFDIKLSMKAIYQIKCGINPVLRLTRLNFCWVWLYLKFRYIYLSCFSIIKGHIFSSKLKQKKKVTPFWGAWVAQLVKRLSSAQVMIPGSWDGAPCWAPCSAWSLVLLLPLAPCALSLK